MTEDELARLRANLNEEIRNGNGETLPQSAVDLIVAQDARIKELEATPAADRIGWPSRHA